MTADEYKALTSLVIQVVDQYGQPEFSYDQHGNPIPMLSTVSILPTATALLLQSESQNAPSTPNPGFVLGGGGAFNITAHTLDLGATLGLMSVGVGNNAALGYNPKTGLGILHGADINVNLSGDLNMFSTTISSQNGGNISVNAAGSVNVGSTYVPGSGDITQARGIFTVEKSDVTVIAGGNIEVNGSRIAAYDGGNVTVESLHGNVDAGSGSGTAVQVTETYVDPVTGQVYSFQPVIPGNGIWATTFPPHASYFPAPDNSVGNVLVEAPEGNINASAGGIVQLSLNERSSPGAALEVLAGYELRDANGNRVLAANINHGTPRIILSDRNVVSLGSTIQVLIVSPALPLTQISLTQVLDASANPLLDASGHPLYVLASDTKRQVFVIADNSLQPYLDPGGNPVNVTAPPDAMDLNGHLVLVLGRNINATGSGVIGANVTLKATGNIIGTILARNNLDVTAVQTVKVKALSEGTANVSGSDLGTSTIIGLGGLNTSGDASAASLLSNNQIVSDTAAAKTGFSAGTAANNASTGLANDQTTKAVATAGTTEDGPNNKRRGPALVQKVSRVTVILPPKNLSENQSPNNHL